MADEDNSNNLDKQDDAISPEKLKLDLEAAIDGWKRTAADFENFRRRKEAENKELVEFAKEVTVAKLLPTLDSLEQALKHMPDAVVEGFADKYNNWQTGVNGIVMQLDKTLEELGVKKIESLGKKFDPHFHEAVREVGSEAPDGTVVDELQTGFELNGKVIRPSQVVISKKQ